MSTVSPSRSAAPGAAGARPRRSSPSISARTIDPFRLLRRHTLLLVFTGLLGVFLGGVTWFLLDRLLPLYSGEVLFEIRGGLKESRDVSTEDIARDDLVLRLATTETMILTSRGILEAAVKHSDVQRTEWFRKNFVDDDNIALVDEAVDELVEDVARRVPSSR